MKQMIGKEYHRKVKKNLENDLCNRTLIKGANTWTVSVIRSTESFLNWTIERLKNMDHRSRKLLIMNEALRPSDEQTDFVITKEG